MSQSYQNQNTNAQSNPLMDFLNSMAGWGGNQEAMQFGQSQPQLNNAPYAPQAQSFMNQQGMQNTMADSTPPFDPSFWNKAFGYQDGNVQVKGWAPTALQAGSGLAESWLGMQQLGHAKDQFAFQKDSWQKQYDNQATLTNANLRDRQSARVAAAPGAYQSVGGYMNQNKVG